LAFQNSQILSVTLKIYNYYIYSSAAECWTQTSAPEAGPLCFACYFDEGRKLAKDPISTFVSLRKIFLEETLKVKNATNMVI